MSDFDLENSRWYSLMKLGNACKYAKANAEQITKWAPVLGKFEYEPAAGTALSEAELALTEALLAVQVTRAAYERVTQPKALIAAE